MTREEKPLGGYEGRPNLRSTREFDAHVFASVAMFPAKKVRKWLKERKSIRDLAKQFPKYQTHRDAEREDIIKIRLVLYYFERSKGTDHPNLRTYLNQFYRKVQNSLLTLN